MICLFIDTKSLFQKSSAVIVSETDNVNNFALITSAIIERDFKYEFLFRTCSVANNPVTSIEFPSGLCFYAVLFQANYGTVPYSVIFTAVTALLQAVLHENTEPFRKNLLETRNSTV